MRYSIKKGFGFGVTSGVITTLGLIIGLSSGTESIAVVVSGILVIAIADAMSDALGIHIAEEFKNKNSSKEVWETTFFTFLSKFFSAIIFIIPFFFLSLNHAIIICVLLGLGLITLLSYKMGREQKVNPINVITEHLLITIAVIAITHFVGNWAANIK